MKKKKAWIVLLSLLAAGGLLAVLLILPALQQEPIGRNWRTQAGYTRDYELAPGFSVTFLNLDLEEGDPRKAYGVYDAEYGVRIANLILEPEYAQRCPGAWKAEFRTRDMNGDGQKEIGVPLEDGTVLWYELCGGSAEEGCSTCPLIEVTHETLTAEETGS